MKEAIYIGVAALVFVTGAFGEHLYFEAHARTSMGFTDPYKVMLTPAPIRPEWVLEGKPDTRAAEIARSNDGVTQVFVWSTTASRFNWFYTYDEVITVLDGDVFIADEGKPERHVGPGEVVFFPAGARTT